MTSTYQNPTLRFGYLLLLLSSFLTAFAADASDDFVLNQISFTNRIVFGVLVIIIGLIFLLSGKSIFKLVLFVSGCIFFFLISFILARFIVGDLNIATRSKQYTIFIVCAVIGLAGGFVALCIYNVGILIIGALLGLGLANLVLNTGLISNITTRFIITICAVIFFAILTLFFSEIITILACTLVGGVTIMYGVDCFVLTGFGNYLISMKSGSDLESADYKIWLMIVSSIILALFGTLFQLFLKRKTE